MDEGDLAYWGCGGRVPSNPSLTLPGLACVYSLATLPDITTNSSLSALGANALCLHDFFPPLMKCNWRLPVFFFLETLNFRLHICHLIWFIGCRNAWYLYACAPVMVEFASTFWQRFWPQFNAGTIRAWQLIEAFCGVWMQPFPRAPPKVNLHPCYTAGCCSSSLCSLSCKGLGVFQLVAKTEEKRLYMCGWGA